MKALILYDTLGGNTQKIAERIDSVLQRNAIESTIVKLEEDTSLEFYDYDLIFAGSPDIAWLPTKKMMEFLQKKLQEHRLRGDILPSAPSHPGKFAVCFCSFCGAHTGINEALSVTQWLAAFFEHIGYSILEKIHVPGEMRDFGQAKGWMNKEILDKLNTQGKLGNIKGRPNEQDFINLEQSIQILLDKLN